ncbi:MAG TPA: hypothetical protein V6D05_09835 [Stenomitos sp.]
MLEVSASARLWGLNGGVLVMCFLVSGLANVIPQFVLLQLAPEHKAFWLPLCLLAGTLGAIVGTLLGGAVWERWLSSRWVLLPLIGTGLGVWGLFHSRDPRLFVAIAAAVNGLGNLLITRFDHLATRAAGDERRPFNDRLGTACRLLGMLLAPWFFTHHLQNAPAVSAVIVASLVGALTAWLATFRKAQGRLEAGRAAAADRVRLGAVDLLVLGHAVTVYASLYLFSANISYFLRDALGIKQATPRAGVLIVTVFLMALVAVALGGRLLRRAGHDGAVGPGYLALAPVLPLLVALVAYEGHAAFTFRGLVAIAATLGVGYGCFLLGLRDHVSRSVRLGKGLMLTVYNNLANVSALLAFVGMLALVRLVPGSSEAYYHAWMRLVATVSLSGIPLMLLARRRLAPDSLLPGGSRP